VHEGQLLGTAKTFSMEYETPIMTVCNSIGIPFFVVRSSALVVKFNVTVSKFILAGFIGAKDDGSGGDN